MVEKHNAQEAHKRARVIASVAATVISLACGTNYVYSAWAPQFADQLKLTSTQSNLIGLSGNLGMYSLGVPVGMFVDSRGPRPAVIVGSILLGLGYYPLHQAYDAANGSVAFLCVASYLTGLGGCMAFAAAVKTSALNWPHHRGTATAFPLAAFGLSAFFFSLFGGILFPGDTSSFLAMLAIGTFALTFSGFFFLQVLPHSGGYHAVPHPEPLADSQELYRPSLEEPKHHAPRHNRRASRHLGPAAEPDIRGLRLFGLLEFWQLWGIMGILTGIGLMTINNIGHTVNALWRHWDDSAQESFVITQQQMHVSILSVCSFLGRLISGVGSDFIVKVFHGSRVWCLVISAIVFCLAQFAALSIQNPHLLGFVSGLTGLAYGMLFGVFPSIVAETFGIHGLSQNWGVMTLSPVVSGNIFNLFYGSVFDKHSIVNSDGERVCHEGVACYHSAYLVTLGAGVLGIFTTLWLIRHQRVTFAREQDKGEAED